MGICQSTKQDSNDMYKTKTLNSTMTRKQNTKDISTSNHNITKTTSAFSNSKERFYTKESISDKKTNSTSRSKAYVKMKSVDVKTSEKLKARNPLRHTSSEKDLKVSAGLVVNCNSENPKDKYKILKKVGEGGYGTVWKVQHIKTGLIRAMKRIPKVRKKNVKVEEIINEIETLKKLDHPNIVKIFEFFVEADGYYLITEYCNYGELFDVIKEKGFLSEEIAANIMYQIFSAVYYCHSTSNIIHRDIKPENCLLDINKTIKLCDFGWTTRVTKKMRTTFCGTFEYMAPEIIKEHPYSKSVDIWSLGIILYEMLHGFSPFKGNGNPKEIMSNIIKGKWNFQRQDLSEDVKRLITSLLLADENKRITIEGVFESKWITNRNKSNIAIDNNRYSSSNDALFDSVFNLIKKRKRKEISPIGLKQEENTSMYKEIKDIEKALNSQEKTINQFNKKTKLMLYQAKQINCGTNNNILLYRGNTPKQKKKKLKKKFDYHSQIISYNTNEISTQTEITTKSKWNILNIFQCK